MRGLLLLAVAAAAAAFFAAPGASAPAKPHPSISMGPIVAAFVPEASATRYSISRFHLNGKPEPVKVTWALHIQLVDPLGAPDPAQPGGMAAIDFDCLNNLIGFPGNEYEEVVKPGHPTPAFLWHLGGCNDNDMGPHGHQGLIKVTVSDKNWSCSETYKGTNNSTGKSVKDGTASEPKCKQLG